MKLHWKIILPLIYFILTIYFVFALPMGILLFVGTLTLPWSFFMSFISGPLYSIFPNIPYQVGIVLVTIIPMLINMTLLYLIGKKIEKKYEEKKSKNHQTV